jgi:hypothetical protein
MGALTSKPYAFTARPWELTELDGFDYLDSLHSPLRFSLRGRELMRVLPALKFTGATEWISDRARFSYDAVSSEARLSSFRFKFRTRTYSYAQWTAGASFFLVRGQLFSGALQIASPTYASGLFETRFAARAGGAAKASDADVSLPNSPTNSPQALVLVGISVRYTHPALVPQLRKFRITGNPIIELGGGGASLADYSLGAGPYALFSFFRFKMRASNLLAGASFLTTKRFYKLCRSLFFASSSIYVLPEAPYAQSHLAGLNAKLRIVFSSYCEGGGDFQIPLAHPLEAPAIYFPTFATGPVFSQQILASRAAEPATFAPFLVEPVFSSATLPGWVLSEPTFIRREGYFYSSYNYYDHFAGTELLRHSNINLLNLRRNADYRHSHFCTV